ncbi:MAG TPA: biotin/lipoyl-containing protein, partial [Rhodanobacteraceae bacterium]|nr:biotin/lipoyl-containing protein [Rhodanobacteraceae bacterium]
DLLAPKLSPSRGGLGGDGVRAANGHAIELRLYAEDPAQNFLPGSGTLERLRLPPESPHVRIDSGVVEGDTVTIFYDPMIAKLIAWDATRERALARMREALAACDIVGPKSNVEFLETLIRHPAITEGTIDSGYLDRHLDEFLHASEAPEPRERAVLAAATAWLLHEERAAIDAGRASGDAHSPWSRADGWRVGHRGKRIVALDEHGERDEVAAFGADGTYALRIGDASHAIEAAALDGEGWLSASIDGVTSRWRVFIDSERIVVHDAKRRYAFTHAPAFAYAAATAASGDRIVAPMPGRIVLVKAKAGDEVAAGDEVLVMEAMKMELTLRAPRAGRIDSVQAAPGDFVEADAVLARLADAANAS